MAYGIGSILGDIDQKADTYRNNPDALAQSYQQNQQLIDLLVLQKLKTDKEAAQRDMQAKMQTPASTIKDQREQQVMGMTRNEVAQQVTPGLQALAQQQQAAQAQGISSLPAPNMQQIGMAEGGIVNFAEGDPVRAPSPVIGYRKDGTAITMEESYDIPGADIARLREDYVRNTQGEYSRENWKAVGEGIMKFFNPPPRTAPLQPERETYLVEKPMAQVDPRLEETQNTTADLQEILSGTNAPAQTSPPPVSPSPPMGPENEDLIYGASLARREPSADISALVPSKAMERTPSTPQSAYTQQLADLRTEQESKLESLIAFLKGAGGQSSFAATMMGGSDAMNAREAQVKGEIMDVLGKLETIDLKERELGIDTERNAIADRANLLQAEVAREQMQSVSDTAEANRTLEAEVARDQIDANRATAKANADAKADAERLLTPENNIAIMKEINEAWDGQDKDELVLAAFNAERVAQGKNTVPLDEVYDPEYVTQFNAMKGMLKAKALRDMQNSAVGMSGTGVGGTPTGFTYLGKE